MPYGLIEFSQHYFDGLEQDCSNSSALVMELLQSCTKPAISGNDLLPYDPKPLAKPMSTYW